MLRRFQLFEFTDLTWWPAGLRYLLTDYLETMVRLRQPFSARSDLIARAIQVSGAKVVIDLCSGGSGPWPYLAEDVMRQAGHRVSIILTDKYPDARKSERLPTTADIRYHRQPIDALAVPKDFVGVRTMFNGLHHFRPTDAQRILQDAVANRQPIVVYEALARNWRSLARINTILLYVLLVTPRIKPLDWRRFLLTYLVPVAPLCIWWDALVSTLRCYTPQELLDMAQAVDQGTFAWEAGAYVHRGTPVTFLMGVPL